MEFVIWIAFLIVYALIQSLGKKKNPSAKKPPQVPGDQQPAPTLADALREIQEALQQARQPQMESQETPAAEPQTTTIPKPTDRKLVTQSKLQRKIEPEFHSLEKRIPQTPTLEDRTKYSKKILGKGSLESTKTYEDVFPESSFYDDNYSHAHMEAAPKSKKKKAPESHAERIRKRLKDPAYLSEAFIIQQILGPPLSKRR